MGRPFDNRLLANTFGIAAVAAGLAGLFIPASTSFVITEAFPGIYSSLWFFGLMLAGIATLAGPYSNRMEGPTLTGVGLGVGGCFLLSYGALLLTVAGWPSFTAACIVIAHAIACLIRANRIRLLIQHVMTSLRTKGE